MIAVTVSLALIAGLVLSIAACPLLGYLAADQSRALTPGRVRLIAGIALLLVLASVAIRTTRLITVLTSAS